MTEQQGNGRKGRLMIWCEHCTAENGRDFFYYSNEKKFSNHCPKCRSVLNRRKCVRCGYEWSPRNRNTLAAVCPKCVSPYWCRERVRK